MATIPKLALIPSGYKAGKIYSVLPTSGVGDFDFTRNTTATRINSSGLIETVASGVPRLNYPLIDGVVNGCPSHLLEPSRLQKIQYSEDFSQGYWTKTQSTISPNSIISPNGSINADKLQTNTSSAEHSVLSGNVSFVSGESYTVSLFAKASEKTFLFIGWNSAGFGTPATSFLDLTTGEYSVGTGQTITVTKFPNGWYKFTTTRTASATVSSTIRIGLCDSILTSSTTGQNTTDGIYIWGAQVEQGSYPTSYIPNYGTSAGVTRSAETANGAGDASTFNGSEGVLFAEISALANDSTTRRVNLRNSSGSNQIRIEYGSSSNLITAVLYNGSNQAVINGPSYNVIDSNKIAFKYKENDFALWINGIKVGTDSIGATIGAGILDRIDLSVSNYFYGNTKQIQYFDSALNDSELETLTSWTSFTDMANSQLYSIK